MRLEVDFGGEPIQEIEEEEILDILSRSTFIIKENATKWDCYEVGWRDSYRAIMNLLTKTE